MKCKGNFSRGLSLPMFGCLASPPHSRDKETMGLQNRKKKGNIVMPKFSAVLLFILISTCIVGPAHGELVTQQLFSGALWVEPMPPGPPLPPPPGFSGLVDAFSYQVGVQWPNFVPMEDRFGGIGFSAVNLLGAKHPATNGTYIDGGTGQQFSLQQITPPYSGDPPLAPLPNLYSSTGTVSIDAGGFGFGLTGIYQQYEVPDRCCLHHCRRRCWHSVLYLLTFGLE